MRWKRLSALEKVATQVGLEPTIGRLTADCINHYATESKVAHFNRCASGRSDRIFTCKLVSIPFRLLFLTGSYIVSGTLRAVAALQF